MKTIFYLILFFFSSFPLSLKANSLRSFPYFCTKDLETLPILQRGRVKPLYVHANETLKFLTGKTTFGPFSSVQMYCLLSFTDLAQDSLTPQIAARVEHVDTRALFKNLLESKNKIGMEMRTLQEENSYQKSLSKLLQKISLYEDISQGQNWLLAGLKNNEVEWHPITHFFTKENLEKEKNQGPEAFSNILKRTQDDYQKIQGDSYLLELSYSKARFPMISLVIIFLALASFAYPKTRKATLPLSFLAILVQTIFIVFRVLISHRAPVTNMYETVLFSGYGSLILSLIIGHFRKEMIFVFSGLCYNVCTLFMINFADGMLSESIGPLVPVLRDNFWLSTHVTTIILSYGALALSWILANTILIKRRFHSMSIKEEKYYTDLVYLCLKFGTVLLAAGIILGGVWADYSWGRFWGWDPKETWSLIVLCVYMAILHGKYTSWIPPHRFIGFTALSFMTVMMAWFGVNYILASGLHSYGFSEGGALFLLVFFMAQIFIYVVTLYPKDSYSFK